MQLVAGHFADEFTGKVCEPHLMQLLYCYLA